MYILNYQLFTIIIYVFLKFYVWLFTYYWLLRYFFYCLGQCNVLATIKLTARVATRFQLMTGASLFLLHVVSCFGRELGYIHSCLTLLSNFLSLIKELLSCTLLGIYIIYIKWPPLKFQVVFIGKPCILPGLNMNGQEDQILVWYFEC